MVADAYTGETAVGVCPVGHKVEVAADRGLFGSDGFCGKCGRIRTFEVWDGPVTLPGVAD